MLVVEAAARSGALNTAGHAADRGIPVLAIPGDVDRPKAAGCNGLIRDGAILARDADDVLAALPLPLAPPPRRGRRSGADGPAVAASALRPDDPPAVRRVVAALADGAGDAARLADGLGLPVWELLPLLTELELAGRIVPGPDGYALVRR